LTWQRGRAVTYHNSDCAAANAAMPEKYVFVVDDRFAVRELLAAHVSDSRG